MPILRKTEDDYKELEQDNFTVGREQIKEKLNEYLEWFDRCYPLESDEKYSSTVVKIPFGKNEGVDREVLNTIVKLGKLLSHLRGNVTAYNTEKTQGSCSVA